MKFARLMRTCERCHLDVWSEWQDSAHQRSWTGAEFQAAIAKRQDKGDACAPCHAPDSLLINGPGKLPVGRADDRELGVNCISCHMNGRTYDGPIASESHGGIAGNESYRESDWCASCHGQPGAAPHHEHATSYAAAPASKAGQTCQECHMPAVVRQLAASKRPLRDLQPAQNCRKHDFSPPSDEEGSMCGAITLEASFSGNSFVAEILPHDGHALDLIDGSKLLARAQFFDADDSVIGTQEYLFPAKGEAALLPGQSVMVELAAPMAASRAELEIERSCGKRKECLAVLAVTR